MIQTYTGTVHTTGTKEDLLEITKEVTELLVDYAGCVLVEETEESSSSAHDEYVAILHVGGELYIRSRLYVDGGGAPSFFNISSGRYLNGEYVWDFTYKNEDLNGRENHNRYAQLIKVNDCVWMLRVQLFSRPTNIDYHLNVSYFCVLPIKSGISGEETYCCVGRSNARITEFPPSLMCIPTMGMLNFSSQIVLMRDTTFQMASLCCFLRFYSLLSRKTTLAFRPLAVSCHTIWLCIMVYL